MKKTLIGSAAIGALALTLIGGGTFAAWSDFETVPAGAGAGILALDVSSVSSGAGATESFQFGNLAPGMNKIQEVLIASSDDDSAPTATLSMTVQNMVGTEDGCSNANSELADEVAAGVLFADRCDQGPATPGGQFADQAYVQIFSKAAVAGSCAGGGYAPVSPTINGNVLASIANVTRTLDTTVAPGDGVCLRLELGLPDGNITPPGIDFAGTADTDNQVQGDSVDFDIRFDLTQNVS